MRVREEASATQEEARPRHAGSPRKMAKARKQSSPQSLGKEPALPTSRRAPVRLFGSLTSRTGREFICVAVSQQQETNTLNRVPLPPQSFPRTPRSSQITCIECFPCSRAYWVWAKGHRVP